jgi:hypothetical protein
MRIVTERGKSGQNQVMHESINRNLGETAPRAAPNFFKLGLFVYFNP